MAAVVVLQFLQEDSVGKNAQSSGLSWVKPGTFEPFTREDTQTGYRHLPLLASLSLPSIMFTTWYSPPLSKCLLKYTILIKTENVISQKYHDSLYNLITRGDYMHYQELLLIPNFFSISLSCSMKPSLGLAEGLVTRSLSSASSNGVPSLCIMQERAIEDERDTPALLHAGR